MSPRVRVGALALVVLVVVSLTGWYLTRAAEDPRREVASTLAQVPADAFRDQPRLVFRSTAEDATYGHVAAVALADPGGARAVAPQVCDRVAATASETVCLRARTAITSAYTAELLRDGVGVGTVQRPGIPSRAQLSPGGTAWASTAFVAGDSYDTANFSTRTFITPSAGGEGLHVEDFTLVHRGRVVAPVDRNYWGVTFVDEDAFYVTAAFGGDPWLARGSVSRRTVETLAVRGECPSVSPDGRLLAHKVRRDDGGWSVGVLDLAAGTVRLLPGERSVDDQVAWLDDTTVLYGLPRTGAESGQSDVWAVAVDGEDPPQRLVQQASSPSVVRRDASADPGFHEDGTVR